jgi:hypothetical protein
MRRIALAVVAAQGISPVMAMLAALIIALILLLAAPVKAQETTAEETTALAADAANRKVEAKTSNVSVEVDNGKVEAKTSNTSVEVDNGKVSVKTGNGSSSGNTTSQQSSLTVQQTQTHEGRRSQVSTGDVNISATGCNDAKNVKTFKGTTNKKPTDSFRIDGNHFRLRYTTDPNPAGTTKPVKVKVDVLDANRNSTNEGFTANDGNDATDNVPRGPGTFRLDITATNARYDITVEDCRGNDNNNNNNRNNKNNDNNGNNNNDNNGNNNNANAQGAANRQYNQDRVIRETIPNRGRLAATGGVPLVGVAFLALASVGLGLSILRFAIRRDP